MEEILKECPRHEMPNPRNYTNIELERKAKQVKILHKDYPNVPEYWLDMLYDYLATKDDETLEKMVNEDIHGEPAKNPRVPVPAEIGIEVEKDPDVEVEKHELIKGTEVPDGDEVSLNYSREIAFEGNCQKEE